MNDTPASISDKIRQQFDFGPYPRVPIDKSPKEDANLLFIHNLVTPYYLQNQKVISTEGKTILDAGCGSGYKSLVLAEANPGATIVGVDLSAESVNLAKSRLQHHGFENTQFHVVSIEDLPSLGMKFDYINCDEVLYLFPNPADGLSALKSVLKPQGIIRSNLHSAWQRASYFRAQNVFQLMGLFDNNPEELEITLVQDIMKALKPGVDLKAKTWQPALEKEDAQEAILMNFLFQGDRGFKVPEMFAAMREAGLEFVSMVNWRHWDIFSLFADPDDLPVFLALSLPEASPEEQLTLFELLHPVHRLLDFWCTLPSEESVLPIADWDIAAWRKAQVHLHPQLRTPKAQEAFLGSLQEQKPLDLTTLLKAPASSSYFVNSSVLSLLLMLIDGPQPFQSLVDHWLLIHPKSLISLESMTTDQATTEVIKLLSRMEVFLYLLIETH
jgi:2-polyprenyl-3-methyl-5-hydroxy-6-metoxy-1,4-benzoquinol methylase